MKIIFGKKIGMTTLYGESEAENVTLVEASENEILRLKTQDKDGYTALQLGLFKKEKSKENKNVEYELIRECRVEDDQIKDFEGKKVLEVTQFSKGDKVAVRGVSKGKGNQGVVKRHGFAGSPASHGHRHDLRAPGSIGSAFPERVFKGKKMAGRMGSQCVTIKNLKVALVDKEKNLIGIKGAVPGNNGSTMMIFVN